MRTAVRTTLTTFVVLGAGGCGGDDATKTVTVPGKTVTRTEAPPAATPAQPPASSADNGNTEPVGPPLPTGVVGVDGRYLLTAVKSASDKQDIGARFFSYEEPSNAVTTCAGARCSVTFRLGLKSGGSKPYTLRAAPGRESTYVGTGTGTIKCLDSKNTPAPSRERIAVRAGSAEKIGGRQVAGRLSAYITLTARCPVLIGTGDEAVKAVITLRGPREG